jgi:hypothetical protein
VYSNHDGEYTNLEDGEKDQGLHEGPESQAVIERENTAPKATYRWATGVGFPVIPTSLNEPVHVIRIRHNPGLQRLLAPRSIRSSPWSASPCAPASAPATEPAPTVQVFQALQDVLGEAVLDLQLAVNGSSVATPNIPSNIVKAFQAPIVFVESILQDLQTFREESDKLSNKSQLDSAEILNLRKKLQVQSAIISTRDQKIKIKDEDLRACQRQCLEMKREKKEAEGQSLHDMKKARDGQRKRGREAFGKAMKKAKVSDK